MSTPDSAAPFVLDRDDNPHPRMLDAAVRARRMALASGGEMILYRYWQGYLDAMCDATGLPPEQIEAWVAAHDDVDPAKLTPATRSATDTVPVQIGRKP